MKATCTLSVPRNLPVAIWPPLLALLLSATGPARAADQDFVVAHAQTVVNHMEAYAQVEPVALLPVRAAQAGVLTGFDILPGTRVETGQRLAVLGGPEVASSLAQDEAEVKSAQTTLAGAREALAIQQQELSSRLSTRQNVLLAESTLSQAHARFDAAHAQLQALRQSVSVEAPAPGIVLSVNAADGERVSAGQSIVTLQPAGHLWLTAACYGKDASAVGVGMTGIFAPASGGEPIAVKVSAVSTALAQDGGEAVGLVATAASPRWLNGEYGTVTLNGPAHTLVAVPTRALILDQGKWWVLVHTEKGDLPREVTPGPSRGWQTFIEGGLDPGAHVVVDNAYLKFHQGISQRYQPPD